jgi:hypothetical protein
MSLSTARGAVTIQQAKEIVRELPHGEETVETTADVLRKEFPGLLCPACPSTMWTRPIF